MRETKMRAVGLTYADRIRGVDTEEATFEDMINGTSKNKHGYEKIRFCREQATQDGIPVPIL